MRGVGHWLGQRDCHRSARPQTGCRAGATATAAMGDALVNGINASAANWDAATPPPTPTPPGTPEAIAIDEGQMQLDSRTHQYSREESGEFSMISDDSVLRVFR